MPELLTLSLQLRIKVAFALALLATLSILVSIGMEAVPGCDGRCWVVDRSSPRITYYVGERAFPTA